MDFLNQVTQRLAFRWRHWPPLVRLFCVGLALAAVGGAAYWGRGGQAAGRVLLFSGEELTPSELTRMEAAFGQARLSGAQIDGQRVSVPEAQKDLYLKALDDHEALPATFYSAHERALEHDHPFTSQRQREQRLKLARERDTALIVRKIRGIEEVCVQYDEVETDSFPRRKRRRATVAVRAVEGRQLEHVTVQAIRSTVMSSIGIAQASDITVLDLNAGRAYDGGGDDAVRQAESDYAAAKQRFEDFYQAKISQYLSMYPGAVVAVTVELGRDPAEHDAAAPLVPRDVSASISLPRSLLAEVWRRGRPEFAPRAARPPEAFELRRIEDELREQIRRSIAPLLPNGGSATEPNRALVSVETFADSRLSGDAVAHGGFQWQAALVDKEWVIGLAFGGLAVVTWLASRRGAAASAHRGPLDPAYSAAPAELSGTVRYRAERLAAPAEDGARVEIHDDRGERLRGKLTDRVKADPRSAAETLKHWLGNVA